MYMVRVFVLWRNFQDNRIKIEGFITDAHTKSIPEHLIKRGSLFIIKELKRWEL